MFPSLHAHSARRGAPQREPIGRSGVRVDGYSDGRSVTASYSCDRLGVHMLARANTHNQVSAPNGGGAEITSPRSIEKPPSRKSSSIVSGAYWFVQFVASKPRKP